MTKEYKQAINEGKVLLNNSELVELIAEGHYADSYETDQLLWHLDLHKNDSFLRCLANEYTYEANKSKPRQFRVAKMLEFHMQVQAFIKGGEIIF